MRSSTIKDLKKVIALSDLSDEQLQWIADRVEFQEFSDGSVMVKSGEPVDEMWLMAEGGIEFYMDVNGKQVGHGRIERSVPAAHTASETFDVGADLGSPVSLDYYDRAPFAFNGKINRIHIRYTGI